MGPGLLGGGAFRGCVYCCSSHAVEANGVIFWAVFGRHLDRASELAGEGRGHHAHLAHTHPPLQQLSCHAPTPQPRWSLPLGIRPLAACSPSSCC